MRQQLLQLQRDGWVEAKPQRGGEHARTGRPATLYRLTEAGDHLFPKQYDSLSVAMIDAIAENFGKEAMTKVLSSMTDERVTEFAGAMRDLTLEQKLASLKSWYIADDPYMEPEANGTSYRLTERNCPFLNTALHRPMLCSVSVNALTRVLGYRVVREEKFQNGDGRCVFRVLLDEPIDPDDFPFKLESDVTRP